MLSAKELHQAANDEANTPREAKLEVEADVKSCNKKIKVRARVCVCL